METQFDLYLICRQDMSTNFVVDMKDIINHPDLQNKDIQFKLNYVLNGKDSIRGLSTGTIQLVGYFDDIEIPGRTTFNRATETRPFGVCLYQTNVEYPNSLALEEIRTIDGIVKSINSAITFFNYINSKNK